VLSNLSGETESCDCGEKRLRRVKKHKKQVNEVRLSLSGEHCKPKTTKTEAGEEGKGEDTQPKQHMLFDSEIGKNFLLV